jgi:hypothetical protein
MDPDIELQVSDLKNAGLTDFFIKWERARLSLISLAGFKPLILNDD